MAQRTEYTGPLTKTPLGKLVAAELGVSQKEGHRAVCAVLNAVMRTVVAGHNVNVTNFGTWVSAERPARTARDLHNGRTFEVPARQGVHFRVAPRFKDLVREGDPSKASIEKASRVAA